MCLIIKKNARLKTAKKDIEVWKQGREVDGGYISRFQYFHFRKNKRAKKERLTKVKRSGYLRPRIYEGYHSFNVKKSALKNCNSDVDCKVGRFVIPKGTRYYEGTFWGCKNRVSETIIFKGWA